MTSAAPGSTADLHREDRRCDHCGYALRGLELGANCPECGRPTSLDRSRRYDGPLSNAPRRVIRAMAWRGIAVLLTLPALLGVAGTWFASRGSKPAMVPLAAAATAWCIVSTYVHWPLHDPHAVWHGLGPRDALRRGAALLQLGWLVVAITAIVETFALAPAGLTTWIMYGAMLVVTAAMFAFAELWGKVAAWARDELAGRLLSFAPWIVLVGILSITRGLLVIAAVLLAIAFLSLVRAQIWSLAHHQEDEERHERRKTRERQHWHKVLRSVRRGD